MIRLLENLVLSYSFSGASGVDPRQNLVYLNEMGGYHFPPEDRPLVKHGSLDELLSEPTGLVGFLIKVINTDRPITAFLDEVDLNRMTMRFLRGVFPNITPKAAYQLIKLLVVDQKYSKINRSTRVDLDRNERLGLVVPTPIQSMGWFIEANDQVEFPAEIKENLSIEYLLVNAIAVNYNKDDRYVQAFRSRLDGLLWNMLVDDYSKRRRKLVMGAFNTGGDLGLKLDPMSDDIDRQIEAMDAALGFDGSVREKTAANALRMHRSIQKINNRNDIHESFKESVAGFFLDDHQITHSEFVELIQADRRRPWSALFGRNKMLRGTGSLIFSYLHGVHSDNIADLTLDNNKED